MCGVLPVQNVLYRCEKRPSVCERMFSFLFLDTVSLLTQLLVDRVSNNVSVTDMRHTQTMSCLLPRGAFVILPICICVSTLMLLNLHACVCVM